VLRRVLHPGALLLVIGAVFVVGAVPHLIAGILQIGGDPVAARIERNRPTPPDALDTMIASRRAALAWYGIPQYHDQIAFAEVRNYLRLDTLPVKPVDAASNARRRAIAEFRAARAALPAETYAWEQLALMELLDSGANERTARYLRLSVAAGPQEPNLVVQRIAIAMMAWNVLDAPTKLLFRRQIEYAAAYRTRELADLSLRFGAGAFVKAMLGGRPDLRARFEEMYFEPEEGSPLFRESAPAQGAGGRS
jgi:hypothetical protein